MDTFLQDLRYGARGLRRSPGFTAVALLTLALGIGVNSAIFGLVNAILLRPLPVEQPGQLVDIYGHEATSSEHGTHSYPNYVDYRAQTTTLSGLIGYSNFFAYSSIEGNSEIVVGEVVTDNYFSVLGVRAAIGRVFGSQEATAPGAAPSVVLSHRFWETRFGADPSIVGKTLRMNSTTYTVVGVAPRTFGGMMPAVTAQLWIPTAMVGDVEPAGNQRTSGKIIGSTRFDQRGRAWMWLRGRVKPGSDANAVRAEFDVIQRRLSAAYPETNELERIRVVPTNDVRVNPDIDTTMLPAGGLLIGAVGLVLIVACANLANLMLARAAGRRRELAVRLAIGAGRKRLVRQMLTESLLLAIAGGAVALPLAAGLVAIIKSVQSTLPIDVGLVIELDWRVMLFTFLAAVVTGLVFGLIPALRSSRPDLVPALKGAGNAAPKGRVELRDALVMVQMAVSLVLVVAGTLLVRSLDVAQRVDLGFDSDRIARFGLAMEMNGYDRDRAARFVPTARARLEALPQVEAVSFASRLPLSPNNNGFRVFIDGRQGSAADKPFSIDGTSVDENYFDLLGVKVIAGRDFEPSDREGDQRVAVVSKAMAEKYWPGEDAVGREFRFSFGGDAYRIIGVSDDYKVNTPGERPAEYLHLPLATRPMFAEVMVRTSVPSEAMVPRLQNEVLALDPTFVFLNRGTMRDLAEAKLFPVRAGAWLMGAFGLLALGVAAVGLYGVIGYSVNRRTRELGIRKALGADSRSLITMVLGEGMRLVVIGGVVGAALAFGAARALSQLLFVEPFDLASFALGFGVLAVVALTANWMPARRAARIDPMVALRQE
jgi:predicted permease